MTVAALTAWVITVSAGLFLLTVWLIEYDRDVQRVAATRLPIPVISTHALLALTGLAVWIGYLVTGASRLAWAASGILAVVAALGVSMWARWLPVYRSHLNPSEAVLEDSDGAIRRIVVPPERHFPLAAVIGHGTFAAITILLVALTTLGAGGS